MNLFHPPFSDSDDLYDHSKMRMIWNISLAVIVLLSAVVIINLANDGQNHYPHFAGIAICLFALTVLKITKRYKIISLLTVISVFLIISLTFLLIKNTPHYTTPVWMMLNILIAFFILGKKWGGLFLILHFTVFFIYFWLFYKSNMENLRELTQLDIVNYIIEAALLGFGFFYILLQFVKSSSIAEKKIKSVNRRLIEKNDLVISQDKEKEVMLREIHHRVKNNLQIITSLLRLQSLEIVNKDQNHAFAESINRVESMALIHEKMYQSTNLVNFDFENYLISLTNNILSTYSLEGNIKLNVTSDIKNIGQKGVVPLSLLFNELITNSIKHGLKYIKNGKISIKIKNLPNDYFLLNYTDNGNWIEGKEKSFGLDLIDSMTTQLDGSLRFYTDDDGTHYCFKLKIIEE